LPFLVYQLKITANIKFNKSQKHDNICFCPPYTMNRSQPMSIMLKRLLQQGPCTIGNILRGTTVQLFSILSIQTNGLLIIKTAL